MVWQGAIGWVAVDLGFALVIIAVVRLVRILKKENPSAFERQVQAVWQRVVGM